LGILSRIIPNFDFAFSVGLLYYLLCSPSVPGSQLPSSGNEQHSSASIFEHVDRIARPSEASRRVPSKIQLIAMQPIPVPSVQHPVLADRVAETNKINKEVFARVNENLSFQFAACLKNEVWR
jgi:hypothetical protein